MNFILNFTHVYEAFWLLTPSQHLLSTSRSFRWTYWLKLFGIRCFHSFIMITWSAMLTKFNVVHHLCIYICMYICLSLLIYLNFYWKYIILLPSKKIFDSQCFLPARYARTIMTQSLWICPTNDWSNFRPMPLERAHANTAWMAWTWKLDVSET